MSLIIFATKIFKFIDPTKGKTFFLPNHTLLRTIMFKFASQNHFHIKMRKITIALGMLTLGLASVLLSACHNSSNTGDKHLNQTFLMPAPLQPGDCVALLCPASSTGNEAMVNYTDSVIQSWGYRTVRSELIHQNHHGFAGTTAQRKEELLKFLNDPDIKCLFSIRGGWGSMMQTMDIPLEEIRQHPKWLVGFSDITAMHSAWFAAGVISVHGPMGGQLMEQQAQDESSLYLRDMLSGKNPIYKVNTKLDSLPNNHIGHAEGRLVGGNVETMMPYMDTPWDVLKQNQDVILFLEDVGENIAHIQRRMVYLQMHGLLERVKGVICGHFTEYTPEDYTDMEEMLEEFFAPMQIPVVYHFPVGHKLPNYPLLHGAKVQMDVTETGVTLNFISE